MSDVVDNGEVTPVVEPTPEEASNAEALARYNESQEKGGDDLSGTPEGFNADGTPIETTSDIPEKYKGKSVEDVIKMHQELEKLQGKPKPEVETPETKPEVKPDDTPVEQTGFTKYTSEYAETGSISEESYKELAENGFPKSDIDAYIEGQKALGQNFTSTIHEITGGEEGYNELIAWAESGMDAETVQEYNEAIQAGNQAKVKQLVKYMSLTKGNVSQQPTRLNGSGENDTGGMKAFSDKGEWARATNNHLYGKDPKYTKMIDKRYLASLSKGTI